jgi:hypothetical protein
MFIMMFSGAQGVTCVFFHVGWALPTFFQFSIFKWAVALTISGCASSQSPGIIADFSEN